MGTTKDVLQSNEKIKLGVWPVIIPFLISGFMGMFSETALNIVLSDLMNVFNITPTTVQWLTTAYLLTFGMLVPVSGFLIKWFTTRQLFITSLSFSIVGFFVAAFTSSFIFLLTARVLQAIGSGLLLPLMFNTVLIIFPPEKRGTAMGVVGFIIMSAPAIGPALAGLLTEYYNWQWIFRFSLPFLIISLLSGYRYIQNVSTITKPPIDILSILLSAIGFFGIVFGFSSAGEVSRWMSSLVINSLFLGVIALTCFVFRQVYLTQPVLNLKAFECPMFALGVLLVIICMMVILSSVIILPIYLQDGLGISVLFAGLVMLPGGLMNGIASQVTGRLFDKIGPKVLVIPGFVIIIVMAWLLSKITQDSSIPLIITLHSFLMLGTAMVMTPVQTNALNQLSRYLYPDGTAIMTTLQQVAGAIGTALAMCFLTSGQKNYLSAVAIPEDPTVIAGALIAGVQNAFRYVLTISIIGLFFAVFIKRARSNET